jgi:hypothetical protein
MDNRLWSALTSPLNSLVGIQEDDGNYNDNNNNTSNNDDNKNSQQDADLKRYRKRYQALQEEVDEVNEEATKTRKQLWEAQDSLKETSDGLKETSDKVRALENHLNEVLELREKDIDTINTLKVANSECLENENRAKESMEIFKKVYKRAQLKIKEDEEEIAILREQRDMVIRQKNSKGGDNCGHGGDGRGRVTANESALDHIKMVSDNKEKRLKNMLFQAERDVEIWKSKHKVEAKRVKNSREQILVMEDPTQAASHMEKQRVQIEQLESQLSSFEEKGERERQEQEQEQEQEQKQQYEEHRDESNRYRNDVIDNSVVERGFCDEDFDDGLTKDLMGRIQNLSSVFPSFK